MEGPSAVTSQGQVRRSWRSKPC